MSFSFYKKHADKCAMDHDVFRRAYLVIRQCEENMIECEGYNCDEYFTNTADEDKPLMKEVEKVCTYFGIENQVVFFEGATRYETE